MVLKNKELYSFLVPISMLYLGFSIVASILVHKYIYIGLHIVSAGSFIMPFWFVMADVITEIYGYSMARRMLWNLMIVEFLLYSALQIFSLVQVNQTPSGPAYNFVIGAMLRTYCAVWFSLFLANFLNTYLLSKLKIQLKSKYFWFRSMAASAIGEILYTAIGFVGILGGTVSNYQLMWMIYWGILLKISITAIAAIPANFFTTMVKNKSEADVYDTGVNFNPFKFDLT